jgi:two-component system LytT family response regulator
MRKIRILIVDDTPLARQRIRRYADKEEDVEIVGECDSGESALGAIQSLKPDLIFLDVQMPGINAFELLDELDIDAPPKIIFVTAYREYAVPAFDAHAVDYLLKPVGYDRFHTALERARETIATKTGEGGTSARETTITDLERISVKSVGKTEFVDVDSIDWIESAGNYLCLHVGKETHIVRMSMAQLEKDLSAKKFARIHRSTVVRIDRVKEIQPLFSGDRVVILHDGTQLTMTRSYGRKLKHLFG